MVLEDFNGFCSNLHLMEIDVSLIYFPSDKQWRGRMHAVEHKSLLVQEIFTLS
jgi:hypothetical protein